MRTPVAITLVALLVGAASASTGANAGELDRDTVLFTRADGLSGAGAVVADWARRAHMHGLDLGLDAAVSDWLAHTAAGKPYSRDGQRAAERALATALERLVAELPPAPRTAPVLVDSETRFYISPDVTWRGAPPRQAPPEVLAAAREAALAGTLDTFLRELLPRHAQYARLVAAAERYAALCDAGGWQAVPAPAPTRGKKRPGAVPPPEYARLVQARLRAEGLLPQSGAGDDSGGWDAATEAALADFRAARQIPAKGLDDPELIAALAVPCEERLATLVLNVRRWRVSAQVGEPTFVEVNLAAQELRYVREHALVMTQRTIVGSTRWYFDTDLQRRLNVHATPILTDHISRIVVNPLWAVPPRIAKNEIDAAVAKDPLYLEKNRMTLVESARGRTYIQAPGKDNALGVIKILFPNDESVYLHDTPKKAPFKLAVRALSHGCVRVQNAVDFGLALLSADAEVAGKPFDAEALRKRAGSGGSIVFDLAAQVPVFLEYYTASVDDAGRVRFHPDIYGYDAELAPRAAKVP